MYCHIWLLKKLNTFYAVHDMALTLLLVAMKNNFQGFYFWHKTDKSIVWIVHFFSKGLHTWRNQFLHIFWVCLQKPIISQW